MRLPSVLPIYGLLGTSSALSTAPNNITAPVKNANHIFNVIQVSMRQWGSSLHHNGVSFFLAGVPAGTHFYHGTAEDSPVNGTEWLAFEPEHAMVFARPSWRPASPESNDSDAEERAGGHGELRKRKHHDMDTGYAGQSPKAFDESQTGYLHTYAAAKDLRLLYIDGMSAAKTSKGTLDSQDTVLFNGAFEGQPSERMRETERARLACEMADNEWEGRVDGVIRMDAGFEIILCRFERDLNLVRITHAKRRSEEHRPPRADRKDAGHDGPRKLDNGNQRRPGGPGDDPDSSRWMRGVTARYNGIGGNRVSLNFEHFVTAFAHDIDLYQDDTGNPRLVNLSREDIAPIQAEITDLVMTHHPFEAGKDWQAIADMVVMRYSDELAYFGSGNIESIERLQSEIERLLSPFIDYSERDDDAEIERCATHFLPVPLESGGLAARAIYSVANRICSNLVSAGHKKDLDSAIQVIKNLIEYLDWAKWKECRGCAVNEVCVVPIWPMGTIQDYENPKCKDASAPYGDDGESYWGGFHH
ncbi:hypothetical protein N7475_008350 [Penicillium sp. IBT 31633x]|nr:hypothetical protein N7475_008350 [Penicillium sp. IBT 31633x]